MYFIITLIITNLLSQVKLPHAHTIAGVTKMSSNSTLPSVPHQPQSCSFPKQNLEKEVVFKLHGLKGGHGYITWRI